MDDGLKTALKQTLSKNSLDEKPDLMPLNYQQRSCADILSAVMLTPNSDDAHKFWNKDTPNNQIVESGYQYQIGERFPF